MLILTIFAMLCLLLVMYMISRDFLYPPVIFTGVWLISLVGVLLSGDLFYELYGTALLVYLIGAIAFSVGGVLGFWLMCGNTKHAQIGTSNAYSRRAIYRFLDVVLIVLVTGLPLYWREISSGVSNVNTELMLYTIRHNEVEASGSAGSFNLINNFGGLAQFLALVMFYEIDGSFERSWRAIISVVLAIVYGAMTGTKGGVVILLLTLYFISAIKGRRFRVLPLLGTIGLALFGFAVGVVVINLTFESYASTGVMLSEIADQILTYWLGGIVAFQRIAENPNAIESTQPIYRFFLETAHSLGINVKVPSIHADYTMIGPSINGNVYTIYFTYFKDWGWFGTVIIMLVLGMGLTFLYKRAMQGKTIAVLFYAMMLVGLVISFNGEHFFLGLNGYIKAFIFFYVVYQLVPNMARKPYWKWEGHV
ncbi:MAG: oligosaccharide repeat unit polymerase [Pseudomonadota bacterium]|nr:oligosaccharide repeat unit polymerase [Pseudomonadota bacterium]